MRTFLQASFPRLDSLDNPELPNNLPSLLSVFVGRHRELNEIRSLVILAAGYQAEDADNLGDSDAVQLFAERDRPPRGLRRREHRLGTTPSAAARHRT